MRPLRIAPLLGLATIVLAAAAPAQETPEAPETQEPARSGAYAPHPEAEEAIGRLKSPFCPGLMLEVCPHPNSTELKDSIQTLAEGGLESDSIVEWMLATYGEEWRAVPKTEGAGIWAWVMPPAAILAGLVIVVLALMKIRARGRGEQAARTEISADEEARLTEALRELEEAESEDALF